MMRAARLLVIALLCGDIVQAQGPLQQRLSVTYQGAAASSVLQAVANVLGVRLELDAAVTGTVTLDVRNVSIETVLRAVCESIGCRWRIDKGTLVVDRDPAAVAQGQNDPLAQVSVSDVFQDKHVDIQWNDASVDAGIKALARILGAEPVVDRALMDERISLSVSKGTATAALNAICEQAGCRWRLVDGTKRVLRVIEAPPSKPLVGGEASGAPPFEPGVARVRDAGVTAPKVLSAARPRYTDAARRAWIQGVVLVECVVEADGTVGNARIVKSLAAASGLDSEALAAARLYLFEPGTRNGKPIPVVVALEMSFTPR
jgi:TonB family protein